MATRAQTAEPFAPLDHQSVHRGAHRSMAVMAARYGLVLLVNVASVACLSRMVGPAVWGTFAVAQFIMNASQEVLGRGFASYLIKKNDQPVTSELSAVLALQLLGGLGIFVILVTAKLTLLPNMNTSFIWLYGAAAIYGLSSAIRALPLALAERRMRYGMIAGVEILESVAFNAVALLLVSRGLIFQGLTCAIIARSLLPALLAFLLQPIGTLRRPDANATNAVLTFGVPFTATSCVNILVLSIPVLLLGFVSDRRNVGIAQMSFSLYSTLLFPTAAILRIGLSALSRLSDSREEHRAFVDSTLALMSLWVLPVVVLFSGLSPIWVRTFLGSQWHDLPVMLILIAPAYMLAGVFWGVLNPALFVQNQGRFVLAFQFVFVAIYASTTVAATALFSMRGVAIAWLATHVAMYPFLLARFDRSLFRSPVLAQIATACAAATTLFLASRSHSAFLITSVGATYLLIWWLSNRAFLTAIRFSDFRQLLSARIGG